MADVRKGIAGGRRELVRKKVGHVFQGVGNLRREHRILCDLHEVVSTEKLEVKPLRAFFAVLGSKDMINC